jgi:hypothetical protein
MIKPCQYGEVSYKKGPLAKNTASLIKKETPTRQCRMSIDECRIKEFLLFYSLIKAERSLPSGL